MQAELQPGYPLLYSVQGYQYCDLLLAEAEQAAGQVLRASRAGSRNPALGQACHAVTERAEQTLTWAEQHLLVGPLDIALDHLTLGRAGLYSALLAASPPAAFTQPAAHLGQAVGFSPQQPQRLPPARPPQPGLAAEPHRPAHRSRGQSGRPGRGLGDRGARLGCWLPASPPRLSWPGVLGWQRLLPCPSPCRWLKRAHHEGAEGRHSGTLFSPRLTGMPSAGIRFSPRRTTGPWLEPQGC